MDQLLSCVNKPRRYLHTQAACLSIQGSKHKLITPIAAYPPLQASAPYELVSFTSCFHGRTMGALALTYKEQYKSPFLPVMPGHVLAEYNNLDSAAAVIKKGKTAAVFVEPVQVGASRVEAGGQQQLRLRGSVVPCQCLTDQIARRFLCFALYSISRCMPWPCGSRSRAELEARPPLGTLIHILLAVSACCISAG